MSQKILFITALTLSTVATSSAADLPENFLEDVRAALAAPRPKPSESTLRKALQDARNWNEGLGSYESIGAAIGNISEEFALSHYPAEIQTEPSADGQSNVMTACSENPKLTILKAFLYRAATEATEIDALLEELIKELDA